MSLVFSDWSWKLNRNFGVLDPINDHLFATELLDNTISNFSTVEPKNSASLLLTCIYLLIPNLLWIWGGNTRFSLSFYLNDFKLMKFQPVEWKQKVPKLVTKQVLQIQSESVESPSSK